MTIEDKKKVPFLDLAKYENAAEEERREMVREMLNAMWKKQNVVELSKKHIVLMCDCGSCD